MNSVLAETRTFPQPHILTDGYSRPRNDERKKQSLVVMSFSPESGGFLEKPRPCWAHPYLSAGGRAGQGDAVLLRGLLATLRIPPHGLLAQGEGHHPKPRVPLAHQTTGRGRTAMEASKPGARTPEPPRTASPRWSSANVSSGLVSPCVRENGKAPTPGRAGKGKSSPSSAQPGS